MGDIHYCDDCGEPHAYTPSGLCPDCEAESEHLKHYHADDEFAECETCGACLMDCCSCESDITGRSPGLSGD